MTAQHDHRPKVRLFIDHTLGQGQRVDLSPEQAHYLLNVMRLGPGARILVFNGRDGEWLAELAPEGRRQIAGVVATLREVSGQIPEGIDWIIRVDGHTDNVPLSGLGEFADNWELSQARALSVVRFMRVPVSTAQISSIRRMRLAGHLQREVVEALKISRRMVRKYDPLRKGGE